MITSPPPPHYVYLYSLVMTNEWGGVFFCPIAYSHLCCDTQTRMRLHRVARPKVNLRWQDLRLNTCTIVHIITKISTSVLCTQWKTLALTGVKLSLFQLFHLKFRKTWAFSQLGETIKNSTSGSRIRWEKNCSHYMYIVYIFLKSMTFPKGRCNAI